VKRTILIAILFSIFALVLIVKTISNAENSTDTGTSMSQSTSYPLNVLVPDPTPEVLSDTVTIDTSLLPSPMKTTVTDTGSVIVYFINNSGKTVYIVGTDTADWDKEFGHWSFEISATNTLSHPYQLDITNDVRDTTVDCMYYIQTNPSNKNTPEGNPAMIVVTGGGGGRNK
jgi:hypothetical protein